MTKELKNIIRMVLSAIIVAFAIAGIFHCLTFNKAMEEMRQQTIEEAVLVSSNENGYVLSFNGELHSYSFS